MRMGKMGSCASGQAPFQPFGLLGQTFSGREAVRPDRYPLRQPLEPFPCVSALWAFPFEGRIIHTQLSYSFVLFMQTQTFIHLFLTSS